MRHCAPRLILFLLLCSCGHTQDFTLHVYVNCNAYFKGGFQFKPQLLQRCPAKT
jgi:hypothetical protein